MCNTGSSTTGGTVLRTQAASRMVISSRANLELLDVYADCDWAAKESSCVVIKIGTVQRRKASPHSPVAKQSCTQQLEQQHAVSNCSNSAQKSVVHFRCVYMATQPQLGGMVTRRGSGPGETPRYQKHPGVRKQSKKGASD